MEAVHNINTLRGTLEKNASLARFTSWKVGGAADLLFRPADLQDLRNFLATEDEIPLTWLGGGTNVLVRDGGIRGAVILLHGCLGQLEFAAPDRVRAEAGVACAKLARFCTDQQLQGAEFLIGIPGTVGGALAMNSGAFEHEIWEFVEHVETVDRRGELHTRNPDDFKPQYRTVHMPVDEWFTGASFKFTPGSASKARATIRALLERRNATQPLGNQSCGSVFRNPQQDHAARLIESCELKGVCTGGAQVSEKHANFIINLGDATARDIEELIWKVHAAVKAKHGVTLIPEVRILGEAP